MKEDIIKTLEDLKNGKILTTEVAYDKILKVFRRFKKIKPKGFKRSRNNKNHIWKDVKRKIKTSN